MKKLLFLFGFAALFVQSFAQAPIVLQDGDEIFTSSRLDTIIAHAKDGNSIYLPGGNVILYDEIYIDKQLYIYGAGHYPDSSAATQVTFVSGDKIFFRKGGSRSTLTGIYFNDDLYLSKTLADTVSYISITRCNLNQIIFGSGNTIRNTGNSNIYIAENVIRSKVYGADAQYCLFEKNIFNETINYFTNNCIFQNNIFLYTYSVYDPFKDCNGLIVNNNIFRDYHGLSNSQVYNNIFTINLVGAPGGTNIGSGNIGNLALADIFEDFTGSIFSYDADFHLKAGCPGINGGTDGTDIGIYGTLNPYKPSAVPVNPHIRKVVIATESQNGFLPVEISVAAQDN
jgi:hypothetical protein